VVANLGAVAAVDADGGWLKWLRLYPRYSPSERNKAAAAGLIHTRNYTPPDRGTAKMWEPCAPMLAGGLLIAAPQDCDYLLALDPDSGALIWRAPRVGLRRLLGAVDGRVVLSGADQVVVRDATNGKALWRRRLGARVIGHGALGRDYIALSTTKALEVVSLSGRPIFRYKWKDARKEAGNVLVHGENIYTVSATHINAYCDMQKVRERLAARFKDTPGAALPRFLAGALELAGGKRDQATKTLREALKLVKPGERYAGADLADAIRGKLWQCHWAAAQEELKKKKLDAALAHLEAALKCAPGERFAPRTILARAKCLEDLKRPAEALEAYHLLMAEHPDAPCARPDGSRLRAWLLAKDQVTRLVGPADAAGAYAAYEQKAGELLSAARKAGSSEAARKVVRLYPNSKAARKALLLAAELAAKAGRGDVELSCLREQVFLRAEGAAGAEARARLALAYARRGYLTAARRVARQLETFAGEFALEGAALTAREFLAAHPRLGRAPRPVVAPPLTVKWKLQAPGAYLVPGCAGDEQLVLLTKTPEGKSRVVAVEAESGKRLWSFLTEKSGLGNLSGYQYPGREQIRVDGNAVIVATGSKRGVFDRGTGKVRWITEVRADKNPYVYSYARRGGGAGRSRYSCSDGVMACWEQVSKVDQLGSGEYRKMVRALSMEDGRELWTLVVSSQSNTGGMRRYYGGSGGSDGMSRTRTGGLVAWTYTPRTYSPKRTKQKTTFMVINATTGRVARRFTASDVAPQGLFSDRLIGQDSKRKMVAFSLEGRKAWVGTGQWQLRGGSEPEGKLVVISQTRSGSSYKQEVALVDARGGKLLWKQTLKKLNQRYYSSYYYGGYYAKNYLILPERLILAENSTYSPYSHFGTYYRQRTALLKTWDMKNGKHLWQTPFVPTSHTRAAGRRHLACAFNKSEQLDKDGEVIVQRRDRFGRLKGKQVEAKALRLTTVVRLFDLDGGKAVQEWRETRTYKAKAGLPVWNWAPRGGGGRVSATAYGLLVSTPEGAVMLAGPGRPARAGKPPAKDSR
jgi:outer membrane protein assembly factor BamB